MALTFLYRKNGGQIVGASSRGESAFGNIDTALFGTVEDPPLPNGEDLGTPKIFDAGTVRDASPGEITAFNIAETQDRAVTDRAAAKKSLEQDGITKKYLGAIVDLMIDEINILRSQHGLQPRTRAQAINAVKNKIDAGDFD